MSNLETVAKRVGCNLLVLVEDGERLARLTELAKLIPCFDANEIKPSDVLALVDAEKAKPENKELKKRYLSSATLNAWRTKLEGVTVEESDPIKMAEKANVLMGKRGASPRIESTDKPKPAKTTILTSEYERLVSDSASLALIGKGDSKIVSRQDWEVIEHIKANDPSHYDRIVLELKDSLRQRLEAEIAERIRREMEEEFNRRSQGYKFITPAQDAKPENVESDLSPEAKKKVKEMLGKVEQAEREAETDADFIDRIKAKFLVDDFDMENEDYQKLLDLKASGDKDAIQLVEMFETSPESTGEATEASKAK